MTVSSKAGNSESLLHRGRRGLLKHWTLHCNIPPMIISQSYKIFHSRPSVTNVDHPDGVSLQKGFFQSKEISFQCLEHHNFTCIGTTEGSLAGKKTKTPEGKCQNVLLCLWWADPLILSCVLYGVAYSTVLLVGLKLRQTSDISGIKQDFKKIFFLFTVQCIWVIYFG